MDKEELSTQKISPQLITQIVDALRNKAFGSIEIYIQNFKVIQITERTITKLSSKTVKIKKNKQYTVIERKTSLEN